MGSLKFTLEIKKNINVIQWAPQPLDINPIKQFIDKVKLINKRSQTSEHERFKLLKDGWQSSGQHHVMLTT